MTWVAIAVSSAAVAGVLTIIDKQLVSKYLNYFPSFGLLLGISSVVWGTVTCIIFPLSSEISNRELLIAFSSGLIWSASLVLHMFVLKTGEASRVSPVFNTYPAIVAILGVSFLGESLVWFGWLAILSTITGAIIVSIKQQPNIKRLKIDRSFILLIIAAFFAALGQIVSKNVLETAPFWNVFALRCLGIGIPFLIFISKNSLKGLVVGLQHPVGRYWILMGEFFYGGFAVLLPVFAIHSGPISVVSALIGTRPIFVFLYSTILSTSIFKVMNEPLKRNTITIKAIAIGMVVAGIATISVL